MTAERQALAARLRDEIEHTPAERFAISFARAEWETLHAALTDDTDRRLLGELEDMEPDDCDYRAFGDLQSPTWLCVAHGNRSRPCPHERAKALLSATDLGDKTKNDQQQKPALKGEGSTGGAT